MKPSYKWVRRTASDLGSHVDAEGNRYFIEWCHRLLTPDGSTEEDHGYEKYASVEDACISWGLSEYVDPTLATEEDLINEENG